MTRFSWMTAGFILTGLALVPQAAAQDWALTITARGGGYTGLSTLNPAGTADFKAFGSTLGGGVGFQLTPAVSFRADLTWSTSELQRDGEATGTELNRIHYDAAVQLRLPGSVMPYALVGVGGLTMQPAGTTGQDRTQPAAIVGVGVQYPVGNTPVTVQAEAKGWLYSFPAYGHPLGGLMGTQFDVGLTAGVSYHIPVRTSSF